jgi:Icc-related predicted phosphoesterase
MNIAIFADVHGRILLCFKLCERWERETGERIDFILQAGDLGAYPQISRLDRATIKHTRNDPRELGFANDFATYQPDVAEFLSKTTYPMIFVRGNHEDHEWLDECERSAPDSPIYSIDVYDRIFCLKTGMPYSLQAGTETLTLLGIGRIGAPVGEKSLKPKYIQPYEQERLYDLGKLHLDILLTHDTALDFVTKGFGMEEIRLILDAYKPCYHFHGHTEEPFTQRLDKNKFTMTYKLADLHFGVKNSSIYLELSAMGILRWTNPDQHTFEVVEAAWLKEYTSKSWRFIP